MGARIGRNQACPCGSGQKFKKCCGGIASAGPTLAQIRHKLDLRKASERIRQNQQGLGRPIIAAKFENHQVVAVRNKVLWSPTWKTFPDFLGDYIRRLIGPEWGNAEISKPFEQRHPLLQWYDTFCRYQQATITQPGEPSSAPITGIVACYLGLAYSLYLLDHNVEVQARLVKRLKDPGNFQGAYYELMVANILIRAGFTLTLEDETDGASKHCEFAAVSKHTGNKYWVEAKMRAVSGLLGKTDCDGTSDNRPTSHLIPHLNAALRKPAADERLIFIDLNTEVDCLTDGKPRWVETVAARLEKYEVKEIQEGIRAYVFVTNVAFHRMLDQLPHLAALPFGLGLPDFNRPGYFRLSETYRRRQKHSDAHRILEALFKYPQLPSTFDGSLPSEAFGRKSSRVLIGETYFFDNVGDGGTVGTVTTATVSEAEKEAYVGITDSSGRGLILRQPMSDDELADYKDHPDAYFGRIQAPTKQIREPYELFEVCMDTYKNQTREALLEWMKPAPNLEELGKLSRKELVIAYCEGITASLQASGFQMRAQEDAMHAGNKSKSRQAP